MSSRLGRSVSKEVLRSLTASERRVMQPIVDRFNESRMAMASLAIMMEPRMTEPSVNFDPDTFAFVRTVDD